MHHYMPSGSYLPTSNLYRADDVVVVAHEGGWGTTPPPPKESLLLQVLLLLESGIYWCFLLPSALGLPNRFVNLTKYLIHILSFQNNIEYSL